jgi:hypothetical protein
MPNYYTKLFIATGEGKTPAQTKMLNGDASDAVANRLNDRQKKTPNKMPQLEIKKFSNQDGTSSIKAQGNFIRDKLRTGDKYSINNAKFVLMAHGSESIVHISSEERFSPDKLADQYFNEGGLKEGIQKYLTGLLKSTPYVDDPSRHLSFTIRLQPCLTGKEKDNLEQSNPYKYKGSKSYIQDFQKSIESRIYEQMQILESDIEQNPHQQNFQEMEDFSIDIKFKAPDGWNFSDLDGRNITYHSSNPKVEGAIDKVISGYDDRSGPGKKTITVKPLYDAIDKIVLQDPEKLEERKKETGRPLLKEDKIIDKAKMALRSGNSGKMNQGEEQALDGIFRVKKDNDAERINIKMGQYYDDGTESSIYFKFPAPPELN